MTSDNIEWWKRKHAASLTNLVEGSIARPKEFGTKALLLVLIV